MDEQNDTADTKPEALGQMTVQDGCDECPKIHEHHKRELFEVSSNHSRPMHFLDGKEVVITFASDYEADCMDRKYTYGRYLEARDRASELKAALDQSIEHYNSSSEDWGNQATALQELITLHEKVEIDNVIIVDDLQKKVSSQKGIITKLRNKLEAS